jgi:hypothetical protein
LRAEALDRRLLLSGCTSLFDPDLGMLEVSGDATANDIAIVDSGEADVEVLCDGEFERFGDVEHIVVKSRAGNDVVTYRLDGDLISGRVVELVLGKGRDTAHIDMRGDDDGSHVVADDIEIAVIGNRGDDTVTVRVGDVVQADVAIAARLGAGADLFEADVAGTLSDADLAIEASGGGRDDELNVLLDLFEDLDGTLRSTVELLLDGGAGDDLLTLDGEELPDSVIVDALLDGGRGDDEIAVADALLDVTAVPEWDDAEEF